MVDIDPGRQLGRQALRLQATRKALYDAALWLFERQGFEETTVQDITQRADTGKGTFFHHFPTKDHVLAEYFDAFNTRLLDSWDRIRKKDASERLVAAMVLGAKLAQRESNLGRVMLGRFFVSPALLASDRRNEERLVAWLTELIQLGLASGEFRKDTDLDNLIHLIISNLSSTVRDYVLSGGPSPAPLIEKRTRLLLRAVQCKS
ncbi:MAG: TetR/AcrR family transcriptional regulator [Planctomycetota bacterium]|jgi:AcrR family transcriptional regulator